VSARLIPDAHLIGYWGFDEALETDPALDGATFSTAADLTVTSAVAVQVGRIGAARQFDGSASKAEVTATKLRLQGDLLLGAWARLTTFNSGGSFLRTITSCGGPTSGDNVLYALFVDSAGRLVYKHTATTGVVIVRSVPIIKASQFYCIFVRRIANGLNQDIEFFVDNASVAVLDVTVNGVGSALPVPPPDANASAVFSVGHSQKESDGAYWQGLLDEISVHDTARLYQPYLRAAYFQVSLRNATTHLTGYDNLVAVSSADMGAGVRWWCFERDRDLYVVKESPFGFFGPETRLTTTGNNASTTAQKAELIYDAVTDTLIVFFVASNRIYKLTAQSTDDPATINMPFTADTGSILKVLDNVDGVAVGMGGGQKPLEPLDVTYVNRSPVKVFGEDTPSYNLGMGGGQQQTVPVAGVTVPTLNFMDLPAPDGFGLAVGPRDGTQSGYRIFRVLGGANVLLGTATLMPGGFYFRAASPIVGDVFVAEAIGRNGKPSGVFSNAVAYRGVQPVTQGNVISVGAEGDCTDTLNGGVGGGQHANLETLTYINRAPVKISGEDAPAYDIGVGGGQHGRVTTSGTNRPGNVAIEVELR
jgi:hypothetical protein